MTRIVSYFIFHSIYTFLYLSPFIILMIVSRALNLGLSYDLNRLGNFKLIFVLLVVAYVFVLPGYRAKLASEAYGERDMGFWEAHAVSGAILKTHLSFLPVIGKFFGDKK